MYEIINAGTSNGRHNEELLANASISGPPINVLEVEVPTLYNENKLTLLDHHTNILGIYISEEYTSSIREDPFRYFVCKCCDGKKINVSFMPPLRYSAIFIN